MEMSQCLLQAIPFGGSPLLQLPGVTSEIVRNLRLRQKLQVKSIQDLLCLEDKEQRKALAGLDEEKFNQAMCIAKQIPMLSISDVHFKGLFCDM